MYGRQTSAGGSELTRDDRLDWLRGLGLLGIVLAHCDPPGWLQQLRNFDVPMMILVAGSAFALSAPRSVSGYWAYVRRRVVRIVGPTWVFLALYLGAVWLDSLIRGTPYPYSAPQVLSAYILGDQFPYVWVLRVMLLVGFAAPFLSMAMRTPQAEPAFILGVAATYLLYEWTVRTGVAPDTGLAGAFFGGVVFMAVPYTCVFSIGMKLHGCSRRSLTYWSGLFAALFGMLAWALMRSEGHVVMTQEYKYPPTSYYLSYALASSFALYWVVGTEWFRLQFFRGFLSFIGRNSLWFYLWHTWFVYFLPDGGVLGNPYLRFVCIVALSALVVFGQQRVMASAERKLGARASARLRVLFSG